MIEWWHCMKHGNYPVNQDSTLIQPSDCPQCKNESFSINPPTKADVYAIYECPLCGLLIRGYSDWYLHVHGQQCKLDKASKTKEDGVRK